MSASGKMWGNSPFWGLSADMDPEWMLTDEQKTIRNTLMEVCRTSIRPQAIHCDKTYDFPRKSMNELAKLGLLGLIVPKHLGGLGQTNLFAAVVTETIARYGCPSTAMVYTMHMGAVSTILFRYHNNPMIIDLLARLDKEKLVGTLSYSDPATGGHFWFPMSSKVKQLDEERLKLLKFGSWATSAGHADWYAIQTVSPEANGDYSNLSCFLVFKDEVRASTDDWSALGMHGNQSGPMVVEGVFNKDRLIGSFGDGQKNTDECANIYFHLMTSSCWNGISLAAMDVAKKHVTRKSHADAGIRVCDYPTIQDYFGECVSSTTASRFTVFSIGSALDEVTNNNDWGVYEDLDLVLRSEYLAWLWQAKLVAAKNVGEVVEAMLHACGGSGYKTDLGLERLFRDGKAGWVMGPSNEVLRLFVGKMALMGSDVLDFWEQKSNERILHQELKKLSVDSKRKLLDSLKEELHQVDNPTEKAHPFQETDFDNPFNTALPTVSKQVFTDNDGVSHKSALRPDKWVSLKLIKTSAVADRMVSFVFALPNKTDWTGCLPGQYVQVRVTIGGKYHERYFSPVSKPDDFGKVEVVLRFEAQGIMSNHFKNLKIGNEVEFCGPCGGFEYCPNKLKELTLLASGAGITPGLQLIRCILDNPTDTTKVRLIYYSEDVHNILYKDVLDGYKDKKLSVFYTLGEVPENWEGGEGFIDTEMIDRFVTKPSPEEKHKIVICGGPTMAFGCLDSLRVLGYPSEMIFIYGQFGTEQVKTVYGRNGIKLSGHMCHE